MLSIERSKSYIELLRKQTMFITVLKRAELIKIEN